MFSPYNYDTTRVVSVKPVIAPVESAQSGERQGNGGQENAWQRYKENHFNQSVEIGPEGQLDAKM